MKHCCAFLPPLLSTGVQKTQTHIHPDEKYDAFAGLQWQAIKDEIGRGGGMQKVVRCICARPVTTFPCNLRPHDVLFPQVPSFNGSSYLRYPGLADTSLSWLEMSVTLKPTAPDGVILYNGHHSDATGDFIALYLSSGHVQFTFDLGTGPATLR